MAVGTAVGTGAALLLLGLLLGGTLIWRLSTMGPLSYTVDDPALHADGFYPVETGEGGVRFRWSRPSAGFLLPALAARQVVTLELTRRARQECRPRPVSGWRPTASPSPWPSCPVGRSTPSSAPSQVGLENAVALVSSTYDDSFYPGPGDARRLAVAVRRVTVAPIAVRGRAGRCPRRLPGACALLLPALVWLLVGRWRAGVAVWGAELAAIAAGVALVVLPAPILPTLLAAVAAGVSSDNDGGLRG